MTHTTKYKIWLIVVSLFLLSFYSPQSIEYNNRSIGGQGQSRTGRMERKRMGPTRTATETQDDAGGQERQTRTFSIIFKFFLLSFSFFFFLVASFSAEYVNMRGGMGNEWRGRDYVPFVPSSGGRGGNGYVFGHFYLLFSSSLLLAIFIAAVSFLRRLPTGGLGRGRTEPTRATIETRDEMRGSTGTCHVIFCCPLYLCLLLPLLLFHCLQYCSFGVNKIIFFDFHFYA